jgi:hypothetical protein
VDRGSLHNQSLPQYFDPDAEPGRPEGGDRGMIGHAFDEMEHEARLKILLRAD